MSFHKALIIALFVRATTALVLAGGLLWAAGSDAAVVATIAATVVLASLLLSGAAMVWLAELARKRRTSGSTWLTAQGAVVLLTGMIAPVLLINDPLIHSAVVLWIFAGTHAVAGVMELIAGQSTLAGGVSVIMSAALGLSVVLRPTTELLDLLGLSALIIGVGGIGLAWAATRLALRKTTSS